MMAKASLKIYQLKEHKEEAQQIQRDLQSHLEHGRQKRLQVESDLAQQTMESCLLKAALAQAQLDLELTLQKANSDKNNGRGPVVGLPPEGMGSLRLFQQLPKYPE